MPLRSIGFEGSYGFGPGTVVGVGGEVRGVVVRGGASVGAVPIGFGDSEGDPSSGTSAVPAGAGDEPATDDAVGRVVVVFVVARLASEVVDDRFVDGVLEIAGDVSPGDCVVGVVVTRLAPPEHETAINVKARTPTIVPALRTPGYDITRAYAKRRESDTRPRPLDR